jgi:hypothetical protein
MRECAGGSAVYLLFLVFLKFIQPRPHAPVDAEFKLSSDFYEESISSDLFTQVATVANSKFYKSEEFKLLSDHNIWGLWNKIKDSSEEDLALLCDVYSLNLIIF